jgi:hypothetical protein
LGINSPLGIGLGTKLTESATVIGDPTSSNRPYLLDSEENDLLAMQKVEGSSPFSRFL